MTSPYVFPGGKLDRADVELDSRAYLDEAPAALQARLAEEGCDPGTAAGLFVAAIREACEESGIVLAQGATELLCAQVTSELRTGASFNQTLAKLELRLCTSELVPWSRWITPVSQLQAKRYDTRFFVARAPLDALARHDGHETTEAAWMRPRQALERYWAREIDLAPPQIMTLVQFSRHDSVAGILDEGRGRPPFLVEPELLTTDAGLMVCYPGDAAHSVRKRAMPGPSRLAIRNRRYEPEQGFEAFFA